MASSTGAHANGVLDMLESKGPTTETERVYRKIKGLHKQLISLCAATDRIPGAADDEQIIISEQPLTFGRPPGEAQQRDFYTVESEIMAVAQKIVRADRSFYKSEDGGCSFEASGVDAESKNNHSLPTPSIEDRLSNV